VFNSQQRFFTGIVWGKNVALLKQIPAADYETSLALLWLIRRRFWEQRLLLAESQLQF
jgi:hypothetical protein